MNSNSRFPHFVACALILTASFAWAHNGTDHHGTAHKPEIVKEDEKAVLRKVNESYLKTVRPVFEAKCFSCHASGASLPWYSGIPFVKGMIQKDVTEAKEHLDMTRDFPFQGHGTVAEDLKAIGESAEKGSMPPFRYRIMHPGSKLTEEEKSAIVAWIRESEGQVKRVSK